MNNTLIKTARALCLAGVSIIASSLPAQAEDRALIVGVENYQDSRNNLPGVSVDVEAMRNLALLMGFKEKQILILQDEKASAEAIVTAIDKWLVKGVKPDDRTLFYFSGHGTQFKDASGDEKEDHKDELLVAYDAAIEVVNNKPRLKGFVLDDVTSKLLNKSKSQHMMVFVDSCHSGTATRSLTIPPQKLGVTEAKYKYYHHSYGQLAADTKLSSATRGMMAAERKRAAAKGYFSLTAAADNEKALGFPQGGAFTLGLTWAVRDAIKNNRSLTPQQLQAQAQQFINKAIPKPKRHHVQLDGDKSTFDQPMALVNMNSGANTVPGSYWHQLVALSDKLQQRDGEIQITSNKKVFVAKQDNVEFTIEVPFSGYLNIVTVDSQDNETVLYPNQYNLENRVQAGTVRIPTSEMRFDLPALPPYGKTLVVAFLTESPLNLYKKQLGGERDSKGNYLGEFATLSQEGTRAIGVASKSSQRKAAGSLVVSVKK